MARIKSALEIALERTGTVKGDKGASDQFEAKQKGKKAANDFLENRGPALEELIKKTPKEMQESFRQGLFDVLLTRIGLPVSPDDMARIERAGRGLQIVLGDSRFNGLFKQFLQLMSRYLDESAQYEEMILRQYSPKLKQKEEELSRRLGGRQVKIDPFQDPEFVAFFNQNMSALKANYEAPLSQVRAEAERLFGQV